MLQDLFGLTHGVLPNKCPAPQGARRSVSARGRAEEKAAGPFESAAKAGIPRGSGLSRCSGRPPLSRYTGTVTPPALTRGTDMTLEDLRKLIEGRRSPNEAEPFQVRNELRNITDVLVLMLEALRKTPR